MIQKVQNSRQHPSMDKSPPTSSTILIVVEQKGSDPEECRERFLAGCELLRTIKNDNGQPQKLLVVGGANQGSSPATIRSWCPDDLLGSLVIDNKAANTHEKALSTIDFIKNNDITTIIQVTSLYHSLRAFLTTLCTLREHAPNVIIKNYVSDSKERSTILLALIDEILLSKAIEDQLNFAVDEELIVEYLKSANLAALDPGIKKYLRNRYAEAARIVQYSELCKGHLVTSITLAEIIQSYVVV